jgi:hypothetical protein
MPGVGCYLTEALSDGHLTLTTYGYGSFACVLDTVDGLFIADKNRLLKHKNLYSRVFNRLISNKNPLIKLACTDIRVRPVTLSEVSNTV